MSPFVSDKKAIVMTVIFYIFGPEGFRLVLEQGQKMSVRT